MIKNKKIKEKIETKTENDPDVRKFILEAMEIEGQKTQWKKTYRTKLDKILKERGDIK